ncbi:MAG: carboxypeptidase regulatory-like domain-containing protein [Acidobacteria bacterium]|nr:carboxypeptidase regulatory-like domain-containing protein [Acidobacteriota bacterium]
MNNRTIGSVLMAGAVMALSANAQVSTGELIGTVTDSSGAAIGKAKLAATNAATGVVRETESGDTGDYIMTLLPPGTYTVSVEAAGFRKTVQNEVRLQINQRLRLDMALQVGQVSETVEVTAAPPLLESNSSSVGSVINQQFVSELPLCEPETSLTSVPVGG